VDYNRAGVPLLEIVGKPDLRSADEARAYVSELRAILVAVGASDGKMEEGSMRVDCNVSVRRRGDDELGTRCEIKNINSLRSLGRAIEYEAAGRSTSSPRGPRRAADPALERGRRAHPQAALQGGLDDYRYFPEPDLVELDPDEEWIDRVRAELPMLPAARRHRLAGAAGVPTAACALA
jgi:aspartyl-tRNA(Asn)/glutamyl-tRNA(Gln) amidotransferase subunit B